VVVGLFGYGLLRAVAAIVIDSPLGGYRLNLLYPLAGFLYLME
jgi:hypothetical protein